ncbi:hypothetical protein BO224_05250 [Erysipelotrichaceae bacterium NYU-BL-E8]|uniref:Uncharacterized protein n=1 Tax=Ileibacterium valens TaxID=1862668 RepID=A0A1U7NG42_9FIRM|nr:hypothetical protein BO222_06165 [Ileibacterium valens]OLU40341.1 hypothetical protein BM735_05675 [Erysipelotrichaceae bacterium NYU-BL-F16]OLU40566.1 hypothetical protein BO224_05250 [Erysipelotrichaceae bacterium NYU-BL-E8]
MCDKDVVVFFRVPNIKGRLTNPRMIITAIRTISFNVIMNFLLFFKLILLKFFMISSYRKIFKLL